MCSSGPCSCLQYYQEKEKETIIDCRKQDLALKDCIQSKALLANLDLEQYWHLAFIKTGQISPTPTFTPIPTKLPQPTSPSPPTEIPYFNP